MLVLSARRHCCFVQAIDGTDYAAGISLGAASDRYAAPKEYYMTHVLKAVLVCLSLTASGFGCTANVENPVIDQTGRTGDTTCVKSCDDGQTTCVAKCTDDACKATCQTTHSSCSTSCGSTDGG